MYAARPTWSHHAGFNIWYWKEAVCVCVCDFISVAMLVDHEQLNNWDMPKRLPLYVKWWWCDCDYYRSRILGAGRFTKMAPPLATRCATWRRTNQLNIPSSICDISLKCSVFSGKCPHPVNWPAPKRIWGRLKKPKRRLVSLTILSKLSLWNCSLFFVSLKFWVVFC